MSGCLGLSFQNLQVKESMVTFSLFQVTLPISDVFFLLFLK